MYHEKFELNQRGVDTAYSNELNDLYTRLSIIASAGENNAKTFLRKDTEAHVLDGISMQSFTQRYPQKEYNYNMNENIKRIDVLVEEIHTAITNKSTDYVKFLDIANNINNILREKNLKSYESIREKLQKTNNIV